MLAQVKENDCLSPVGYMKVNFGSAQTEKGYDNSMEIQRIYVSKSCKGMGIGSRFMDSALTLAKKKGVDYVWLGVWEHNHKAIKFYQDKGFVRFGEHFFVLGEDRHASVFHKLTQTELTPKHTKEILLPLLYKIFPRWILYPAIAQGEYSAVKNYVPVAEKFPEVESVKNDEKRHGDTVKGLLNKEQDGQFPEGMFRFEKRIER